MKDINDLRRERTSAAIKMEECANAIATLEDAETAADAKEMVDAVAAFDAAEASFKAADKAVKRAEAVEQAKAASAKGDEGNDAGSGSEPRAKAPKEKGIEVGLIAAASLVVGNRISDVTAYLGEAGYGKIAASLNRSQPSAGGVTIPEVLSSDFIELLREDVVVRRAGPMLVDMPAGALRKAMQTGSSTATYGTELAEIAVSEPTLGDMSMNYKKLTGMVPISNDLARQSPLAIAQFVTEDLRSKMAEREDLAFLRGDGSNDTPKGLRHWMIPAHFEAGIGVAVDVVERVLRAAKSKVITAKVRLRRPAWFMNPETRDFLAYLRLPNSDQKVFPTIDGENTLLSAPIFISSALPTNLGVGGNEAEVLFAEMSQIMVGDTLGLQLSTSTEAAFRDGNGDFKSAYQTDQMLVRGIAEHDLAPRHDRAISGRSGAGWTL